MPTQKQLIIIFGILGVVAFGLGYWDGMPEKDSGAEVVAPTIITNVVTNVLKEVVTNIVRVLPPIIPNPIIEKAIRKRIHKPTGELTKADLEKVTGLDLGGNKLTNVKGLEKLTKLRELWLDDNPDLTKAQIAELQKALPNCNISSNPTK